MSQAEELLNSVTTTYATNSETEPHIIVGADRFITVPEELKRIAVQHDNEIETVTFDCPRYWDNHDMSKMYIFVNYMREDGEKGSDLATNVTIDAEDENIMHFDWTITGHLSAIHGPVVFLVCIQNEMKSDGTSGNHWNSELCTDLFVSEGLEVESFVASVYPGIITQLLTRMDGVEARTSNEAMVGYVGEYLEGKPEMVQSTVEEHMDENGSEYVDGYFASDSGEKMVQDCVNEYINSHYKDFEDVSYDVLVEEATPDTYFSIDGYNVGDTIDERIDESFCSGAYSIVFSPMVTAGECYLEFAGEDCVPPEPYVNGEPAGILVVDGNNIVIQKVTQYDFSSLKRLRITCPCTVYMTGNLAGSYSILARVHTYNESLDLGKHKPYYIDALTVDTTDTTVGDAVTQAFLDGRNIVVLDGYADAYNKKAYLPATGVMLARRAGTSLTIVYMHDGVAKSLDLSTTRGMVETPHLVV